MISPALDVMDKTENRDMTINDAEISWAVRAATRPLRRQRDAWKRAAIGLFALSLVLNMWLYGTNLKADKLHQEELAYASSVRDRALQELETLANSVARDKQARQEQAEAYEAIGAYQYMGVCTITAYCPCEECCGRWADGLTATGIPAEPGIVAVDPEVIPLGSTVIIDGQRYLAADTGVQGLAVDIFLSSHDDAARYGVRRQEVWVIPPEKTF